MDLDYVDIVMCHRFDAEVPLEETCRAMHSVIENGKALYWGTSEWPVEEITTAIGLCEKYRLHKPVVEQV